MTINVYLFLLLALAGRVYGVLFRHIEEVIYVRIVAHLKSIKIAVHYSRADNTCGLIFENVRELLFKKYIKRPEFQITKGREYSLKLILRFAQYRQCRYTFKNIFHVK